MTAPAPHTPAPCPPASAALGNSPEPARIDIASDLLRRKNLAETIRSIPVGERTDEQLAELRRTDRANAEVLRSVVNDHGWPGAPLVGADAARAAWLIALRSDDAEFQADALAALAKAVTAGEAEPAWWAHLYDRSCALTGVKQWFGTQFQNGPDGVEVYPVDDPENLDARRAQYGLEPHEKKVAAVQQRHGGRAA
ncbi:DUF6624 domain-containing protein [Streptantibioticus silvisoli]|uniref:Uncharacterized protein n=1 Tax=Streptantibioticus silvisoli TaxID=2705255 RepID=A0ABT6W1D9_9ACTN|nr:DUF6624 domain-containing protein [Streptantibioticus silvisoli]MDI5964084.1 hypothetical protein [Streptantibioticus silvisoli]